MAKTIEIGKTGTLDGKTYKVKALRNFMRCHGCAFERNGFPGSCETDRNAFGEALGECAAMSRSDHQYVCFVEVKGKNR